MYNYPQNCGSLYFIGPNGKLIKTFNDFAKADDTIEVIAGVYDVQALSAMYPDVIKAALENAISKIK